MADRNAVEAWKAEIVQAGVDGLAEGLRIHLPVAVGLLLVGVVICALMSFAHFVLAIELPPTLIAGSLLGAAGVGAPAAWRLFKDKRIAAGGSGNIESREGVGAGG